MPYDLESFRRVWFAPGAAESAPRCLINIGTSGRGVTGRVAGLQGTYGTSVDPGGAVNGVTARRAKRAHAGRGGVLGARTVHGVREAFADRGDALDSVTAESVSPVRVDRAYVRGRSTEHLRSRQIVDRVIHVRTPQPMEVHHHVFQ
jgi:hypothetical protein